MSVLDEIQQERQRQDAKWGEQNHDPVTWLAILTEEVGEVAEQSLKAASEATNGLDVLASHHRSLYRQEMMQVAAVAIAALESFDRNEGTW